MLISLVWFCMCLLLMPPLLAHAVDIYLADGSVLGAQSPEPKWARPVLFVHGTADDVVPAAMTQRMFDAAPEPKRLLMIEGGSHSNFADLGADDYRRVLAEFIATAEAASQLRSAKSAANTY